MSDLKELRDLQREYIANRDGYYEKINRQDQNLRNCAPTASLIRQCRENEEAWRAKAREWQARVDAIQRKIDEAIGLTDD